MPCQHLPSYDDSPSPFPNNAQVPANMAHPDNPPLSLELLKQCNALRLDERRSAGYLFWRRVYNNSEGRSECKELDKDSREECMDEARTLLLYIQRGGDGLAACCGCVRASPTLPQNSELEAPPLQFKTSPSRPSPFACSYFARKLPFTPPTSHRER